MDTFDIDFTIIIIGLLTLLIMALLLIAATSEFAHRRRTKKNTRAYDDEDKRMRDNKGRPDAKSRSDKTRLPTQLSKENGDSYFFPSYNKLWAKVLSMFRRMEGLGIRKKEEENSKWDDIVQEAYSCSNSMEASPQQELLEGIRGIYWQLDEIRRSLAKLVEQNERYQSTFSTELKETRSLVEEPLRRDAGYQTDNQRGYQWLQQTESRPSYRKDLPLESLCRLYNAGVDDPGRQQEFRQKYKPTRIVVVNFMERTRDPNIVPQFKERNDGDYEVIRTEDGDYAVVPRFNLPISEANYGPGAIEKVFNCLNYVPGKTYHRVRVNHPAIFDRFGENWEIRDNGKGELDFSRG